MHYQIGLDLGSTRTATATCREVPRLESVTPTVVFANPDGSLVIGEEAERRASADPSRVARRFLRRVGDPTPLRLGAATLSADVLTARFVTMLLAQHNGRVAVAHPAAWGPHRLESLRRAGLPDALFVPAPQAAAVAYDEQARLEPGSVIAVYDLGGGGFEAAVVRKLADSWVLAGRPEESEVGGLDFDEAVFAHVVESLEWDSLDTENPVVLAAVADLRRACTAAKEQLSSDTEVRIPVAVPGISAREVRLTRAEFEEMIRPALTETTATLLRALQNAGTTANELAAVLLVGGSARIPLVTQEVSALLGRSVTPAFEGMVAVGAALSARVREPAPEVATVMWSRPPMPAVPAVAHKRTKLTPYITAAVLAAAVGGGLAMNTYFAGNATPDTTTSTTPSPTTEEPTTVAPVTTTTVAPVEPQKTVAPPPPAPPTKRTTTTTWPSSTTPSVSKSVSVPAPVPTSKASTKAGAP
ncbi:Hsp70 protein [Lentzea waywayandensis]|uniref:Hsp70 protein n=1 Tax=Lentzea waywayandensis TaxID=84724 RepID=A0A1I6D8V2_9PSEU|nr:Hsp70 family protein [Lentzea waywayandensis]SFR01886.1 Hsp70 protein [Lentzea waywayandensis]